MKLSKLIEIAAQYIQEQGDVEFMYRDSEGSMYEEISETDLNIERMGVMSTKVLVLRTVLEEEK